MINMLSKREYKGALISRKRILTESNYKLVNRIYTLLKKIDPSAEYKTVMFKEDNIIQSKLFFYSKKVLRNAIADNIVFKIRNISELIIIHSLIMSIEDTARNLDVSFDYPEHTKYFKYNKDLKDIEFIKELSQGDSFLEYDDVIYTNATNEVNNRKYIENLDSYNRIYVKQNNLIPYYIKMALTTFLVIVSMQITIAVGKNVSSYITNSKPTISNNSACVVINTEDYKEGIVKCKLVDYNK